MSEQNKVFKSKNLWVAFSSFLMPFLFLSCVLFTYFNVDEFNWDIHGMLLIMFGIMSIFMPKLLPTLPKEIIFEDKFIVKRYIYQDLIIEYSDVLDLDSLNLVTKKGSIALNNTINKFELLEIIDQLIQEKKIKIEGKLRKREERSFIVAMYAAIPAFILYFLVPKIFNGSISKTYSIFLFFIAWIFFHKIIDRVFAKRENK